MSLFTRFRPIREPPLAIVRVQPWPPKMQVYQRKTGIVVYLVVIVALVVVVDVAVVVKLWSSLSPLLLFGLL